MQNLIIWTVFDYALLVVLAFLPILYRLFFWLYVIQLKEYRWDRFKEYISTKQGKSALFNIFFVIELILLIFYLFIWWIYLSWNIYYIAFWGIAYQMMFYYLILLNIFVIWKIFRKKLLKPKITGRLLVLFSIIFTWITINLYWIYIFNLWNYIYLYILSIFLLMPAIIFFYNFISLPLVNYKKNKQINAAIIKSSTSFGEETKQIKIWITWSYWKSSIKEFLASILEQDWNTLKTPENQNTEMSVSNLILNKLSSKYKYFIAEMGAYKIWEVSLLWKIANHKYWFLTAIWTQHIALFGNQENIRIWKSEIAESVLKNNWILYINWNNKQIRKLKFSKNLNIVKYWKSEKSDAIYSILKEKDWKTEFNFEYKKINSIFEVNIIWEHNILNLTWVIACCIDLGLSSKDIKKYLKNLNPPKNSLEIIKKTNLKLIENTYNLSLWWLYAGFDLVKKQEEKEKILILDDVLELWKIAEIKHYEIWKKIAKEKIFKEVLFVWVNYRESFVKGLLENWFKKENIFSPLNHPLQEGDITEKTLILFMGRGGKKYFNIFNK